MEGAFARIFISSLANIPPAVPHIHFTIVTTSAAFWKNGSFDERVLQEISGTSVDTNRSNMHRQW